MKELKSWIIIPVFNRREVTLACLGHLRERGDLARYQVLVVDGGSSDGTPEAVREKFGEVEVLVGRELFWTEAVEEGMRVAVSRGAEVMVWLNDDAVVEGDALGKLEGRVRETRGIASAQGRNFASGEEWFFDLLFRGRFRLRGEAIGQPEAVMACDAVRGNLVAIHREVVERIGFPDGVNIPQANGDTDYSMRASKVGIVVEVLGNALVTEKPPEAHVQDSFLRSPKLAREILGGFLQRKNCMYPPMVWKYNLRHWGVRGGIFTLYLYVKLLAILGWKQLREWCGKR